MFNSKRLRDYLAENQLSQSDFAMKIGTSQTMVYFLANGIKEPSVKLLTQIADVMGCTTDELLGRGGDGNAAPEQDAGRTSAYRGCWGRWKHER